MRQPRSPASPRRACVTRPADRGHAKPLPQPFGYHIELDIDPACVRLGHPDMDWFASQKDPDC